MKILILVIFMISISVSVLAQNEDVSDESHKSLMQQIVEYIREGSELFPSKKPPLDKVQQLETRLFLDDGTEVTYPDRGDFGFGFLRFYYNRPGGYCFFIAEGFALGDEYARYKVGLKCDPKVWPRIREQVIKEWKTNGGPAFTEEEGIFAQVADDGIVEKYRAAVSKILGPMRTVTIPANLKKSYDHLIDPMTNSDVGDRCGGDQRVPGGKTAILQIFASKRIDILENILRGYNPGGRIYAASALLKMQKAGFKLDPTTLETIEKVKGLDSVIGICQGIKVFTENGKDALKLVSL